MQYNSDSDSQDIVSLIGDMTGIDTTNELKQITRASNEANKKIWTWIFQSYGGWQYDDSNNIDMPSATTALVADQKLYTLPAEAITVRSLEYKNAGGVWTKLTSLPVDRLSQKTSDEEFQKISAEPRYYGLVGEVIKLYPASSESRATALRIRFDRGSVVFDSTDTLKVPGFASEFHEAVAVGAAYYISRNKKLEQTSELKDNWIDYENRIKDFYISRWEEEFPPRFETMDTLRQYI